MIKMKSKGASYIHAVMAGLVVLAFAGCNTKTAKLNIKAYDAKNVLLGQSRSKTVDGVTNAQLLLKRKYQQGDYLLVNGAKYLNIQLDQDIPACHVYAPSGSFKYPIPFGKEKTRYSPKSFAGDNHKISVKACYNKDISQYRNLALNPFDIKGETEFYPHATSNSEYGQMSHFSARSAIDGHKANKTHGAWPVQSWGPDKDKNIWFKIDFGREVQIDKLVIVNRADYDHDSYWKQATVEFSDGTKEIIKIGRTELPQEIMIKKHVTSWIKFTNLKYHKNKWIAWAEVEVWGNDLKDR